MKSMNKTWVIAGGVVATVVSSFIGLVVLPDLQIRTIEPGHAASSGEYPIGVFGETRRGRDVYISMGCVYCHSQQVRAEDFGADIDRGWGTRQSEPMDYIGQSPILLGTMRTGPDLANIGGRQPSDDWHHLHLYEPTLTSAGSNMPPFPFLYDLQSKEEPRPEGAVAFPAGHPYEEQYWIVPTGDAKALVAYLKSLDQDVRSEP